MKKEELQEIILGVLLFATTFSLFGLLIIFG